MRGHARNQESTGAQDPRHVPECRAIVYVLEQVEAEDRIENGIAERKSGCITSDAISPSDESLDSKIQPEGTQIAFSKQIERASRARPQVENRRPRSEVASYGHAHPFAARDKPEVPGLEASNRFESRRAEGKVRGHL